MVKKLGGVNVRALVNKEVGRQLRGDEFNAVLVKVTPGQRSTGASTSGTNPTDTNHKAKGLVSQYSDAMIDGQQIKRSDRRVLLLGGSIQGGAVPEPGDKITIEGVTYNIVEDGVKRDPVDATYVCQCRGRR